MKNIIFIKAGLLLVLAIAFGILAMGVKIGRWQRFDARIESTIQKARSAKTTQVMIEIITL